MSRCDEAAPAPPPAAPSAADVPELARAAEEQLRETKGLRNPGQFSDINSAAASALGIDPFDGFPCVPSVARRSNTRGWQRVVRE